MKKYIFMLAVLILPVFAHADGGFLNVDIQVSNTHGGLVTAQDVTYDVMYDGNSDTIKGNIQAYGFPRHTNTGAYLYYNVIPTVPQGYVVATSTNKLGCNDSIADSSMKLLNCTIYLSDDNFVAPVVVAGTALEAPANFTPTPVQTIATSTQATVEAPATAEDQQVIIKLLLQLIDLYKQLLALQSQVQ